MTMSSHNTKLPNGNTTAAKELSGHVSPRTAPSQARERAQQKTEAVVAAPECASYGSLSEFITPYLTCSRCNSIVFINAHRVRRKEEQLTGTEKPLEEYEQVPTCPGCGSTRYLRAGVVSFQGQIEDKKRAIREFERKRGPATALIQRVARGFLGRLEFRRRLIERERYLRKINRAATRIQTRVRGMQARRCSLIERCLLVIRRLAPSILKAALAARPDRSPVFWYSNAAELNILYWNYREFVRRAGGKPSLIQVEKNILEVTRRMLMREYELVSRIQALWRGATTRLVFREFKRQKAWWNGIRQSPAIKIQRLYRGHTARKASRAYRATRHYSHQMQAYRDEMTALSKQEKSRAFRDKLLLKYRRQFQLDETTRMMDRQRGNQTEEVQRRKQQQRQQCLAPVLSPETYVGLQYSLGSSDGARSPGGKLADEDNTQGRQRNPNAQRFARLRQQLDTKMERARGPRIHILKARQYAPVPPSPLAASTSDRE